VVIKLVRFKFTIWVSAELEVAEDELDPEKRKLELEKLNG